MSEKIRVECPKCGATAKAPITVLGKSIKCPKCQNIGLMSQIAEIESPVNKPAKPKPSPLVEPKRVQPVISEPSQQASITNPGSGPTQVNVHVHEKTEKSKHSNLGIASLVLGILAMLIAWIPFIGLLGLPFSLVGLVLGGVAIFAAVTKKEVGILFPVVGTVTSGLALVLAFLLPAL